MVTVNELVPNFSGMTNDGLWTLSEQRGKNVVVYFYPRDNTPGCTTEGNDFNEHLEAFAAKNTIVVGISHDTLKKHENFIAKHGFNFPLIADENKSISELFDVYQMKKFMGKESMGIVRSTFLIDADGVLIKEWRAVRVKGHVEAVLEAIA